MRKIPEVYGEGVCDLRDMIFVPIFTFTADVCKIKFRTTLILLHNTGLNSYVQT